MKEIFMYYAISIRDVYTVCILYIGTIHKCMKKTYLFEHKENYELKLMLCDVSWCYYES